MKKISSDYRPIFEGWELGKDKTTYYRLSGPVKQMVWFQAMSTGKYRPTHSVGIRIGDGGGLIHQFLDIRSRQISVRWHENHIEKTSQAMLEQFVPHIASPLTPLDVYNNIEFENLMHNPAYLVDLAYLAAHLDLEADTVKWIERGMGLILSKPEDEREDFDIKNLALLKKLKRHFNAGTVKDLIEDEVSKFKNYP